ncbi:efflux transporter periplasmic adaptor subunit [Elizabethkingia miricola]|uniref:Cobalt-zinc-cadmium efflux system membrane fusion protein n=1 Tax=Elizabethkingia miricola TaxID=172045 RepID=A0ABY3NB02_ELIMR|nr:MULTISPECIES: efflux RND transporter periplasmic adaptor subunit [Elizabethkingia]NHQ67779.1 efflux RND transporter periplasmic adaptor subunit [Elizabethkingia miricola]NHQ72269.1 efflux RND transporter periplasmic adaptor subunit [Elizabethkingia miricola]NHQ79051.1 efflux RND transporter periplasmic adaptor subunit [Elizabethkingia miricola]OBS13036.1 efflux transporter periplasmic adaptor subunit [Elizabethkingia miricola]PSL89168.1 efflux RND transporter periplasmic adaptor subunit [El
MKKIIISLASAVLLMSCSKEVPQKKGNIVKGFEVSNEMMKTLEFAEAKKEYIKEQMSFFGKISADRNSYIDIYPLVGGNVMSVNVELGDYVHKGQVLATIRSTEVAGFQKDLSDAKTDLAEAKNQLRVAEEMYEGKLNTRNDVLTARSELTKAQDQLTRAEAVSRVYNVKSGNIYSVVAPINGYIVQKNINKDMQLRSDRSDNIFDVANTKDVWALVNINESDIDKISLGMKAEVSTLSYPDKVFHGRIDKIFKIIDPQTNAMQARVVLDNTNGLLVPESKATIKVDNTLNQTAVSIPTKSVIFDNNRYFIVVFKSRNDIKVREIKILKQSGDTTYVEDGVSDGEKVVSSNQLLIYQSLNN